MAESTLSLAYADFRLQTARFLGFQEDSTKWTTKQSDRLNRIVAEGIRRVLHPSPPYDWGFLEPIYTLTTVASTEDYDLPDGFGYLSGIGTFQDTNGWQEIRLVPERRISLLRQTDILTGRPQMAATRPKAADMTTGSRFEVLLWPKPDAVYNIDFRMHALQDAIASALPYPLGGQSMSSTYLAACLWIAESWEHDLNNGQKFEDFQRALEGAMAVDRMRRTPDTMGYMGRKGRGNTFGYRVETVKVNGVEYT